MTLQRETDSNSGRPQAAQRHVVVGDDPDRAAHRGMWAIVIAVGSPKSKNWALTTRGEMFAFQVR